MVVTTDLDLLDIAEVLEDTPLGERLSFWFCPAASEPRLVVSSLREDPEQEVVAWHMARREPIDATAYVGFIYCRVDGGLDFFVVGKAEGMLGELRDWVQDNIEHHPQVGRCVNAHVFAVTRTGAVGPAHADADTWQGLEPWPARCTPLATASMLTAGKAGDAFWFWIADARAPVEPLLILQAEAEDPEADEFAQDVRLMKRLAGVDIGGHHGVLTFGAGGLPMIYGSDDSGLIAEQVSACVAHHGVQHPTLMLLLHASYPE